MGTARKFSRPGDLMGPNQSHHRVRRFHAVHMHAALGYPGSYFAFRLCQRLRQGSRREGAYQPPLSQLDGALSARLALGVAGRGHLGLGRPLHGCPVSARLLELSQGSTATRGWGRADEAVVRVREAGSRKCPQAAPSGSPHRHRLGWPIWRPPGNGIPRQGRTSAARGHSSCHFGRSSLPRRRSRSGIDQHRQAGGLPDRGWRPVQRHSRCPQNRLDHLRRQALYSERDS